jgi:hypothetical protein
MDMPADFGAAGRRLWDDVAGTWELSAADAELLTQACRCADHLARLNGLAAFAEPIILGRFSQILAHPIYAEIRAERRTLTMLINALDFADAGQETEHARPRRVA